MKLLLTNGYPFPFPSPRCDADAMADAASGTFLELQGVVSFEWLHTVTVEFVSDEAYEAALLATGWQAYSYRVLEACTSGPDGYDHPAICAAGIAYCGFNVLAE